MTVRIRVIPCLDVADGRVVKGVNFVDLKDAGDPVEQARAYDAAGADELCFLDISASHEGRGTLLDMVRRTAEVCFMPLTVGGGVRSPEDARALLLAGMRGAVAYLNQDVSASGPSFGGGGSPKPSSGCQIGWACSHSIAPTSARLCTKKCKATSGYRRRAPTFH